ncbi:hypothetical protein JXM83_06655 [Candidatus Woesearchaeota archaeon]|nr:hypothetical protein [Candidatus Woesearchaeota archaeon]
MVAKKTKRGDVEKNVESNSEKIDRLVKEVTEFKQLFDYQAPIKSSEFIKNDETKREADYYKEKFHEQQIIIGKLKDRVFQLIETQRETNKLLQQSYHERSLKVAEARELFQKSIIEKNAIIENLTRRLNYLQKEISEIRHSMNTVELTEEVIKKKEEQFNEKIFAKEQIIHRLETDILRLQSELSKKADYESELKSNIFKKDKEIINQNERLIEITQKESKIRSGISAISDKVTDLNKKLYLTEEEVRFKNRAIKKVIEEMKNLENLNRQKNAVLIKLQKENSGLNQEYNSLKQKFDSFKEAQQHKEKATIELENELGIKRVKLVSAKKTIDKLMSENNTLRETLKKDTQEFTKQNIILDKELSNYRKKHMIEVQEMKKEQEIRIEELIKEHTNQEISMKLRIENLNKIVAEQNKVILDKREKEKELAVEFTARIKEALMLGSHKLADLNEYDPEKDSQRILAEESRIKQDEDNIKAQFRKKLGVNDEISHIEPLVKMALDHGENPDKVMRTLLASGHPAEKIKEAINKNIKKN